eukprot:gene28153-37052_t
MQDELVIAMPDIPVQTAAKDSVLSMLPGLTKPLVWTRRTIKWSAPIWAFVIVRPDCAHAEKDSKASLVNDNLVLLNAMELVRRFRFCV